ncbi:hypothetical protein ACTFIY_006963 [Dictyostelium cf. discoideum]
MIVKSKDYDCLKDIVTYYEIDTFSTDASGLYNFCNVVPLIDCDDNGNLNGTVTLIASNKTQSILDPISFSCLSNFTTLDLTGEIIETYLGSDLKLSSLQGLEIFKISGSPVTLENDLIVTQDSLVVLELEICNFIDFTNLTELKKVNLTLSSCFSGNFDLINTITSFQLFISSQNGMVIPLSVVSQTLPKNSFLTVKVILKDQQVLLI